MHEFHAWPWRVSKRRDDATRSPMHHALVVSVSVGRGEPCHVRFFYYLHHIYSLLVQQLPLPSMTRDVHPWNGTGVVRRSTCLSISSIEFEGRVSFEEAFLSPRARLCILVWAFWLLAKIRPTCAEQTVQSSLVGLGAFRSRGSVCRLCLAACFALHVWFEWLVPTRIRRFECTICSRRVVFSMSKRVFYKKL